MGRGDQRARAGAGAARRDGPRGARLYRGLRAGLGRRAARGSATGLATGRGARSGLMDPRHILVLAPHPDDEIVACGIAARRARLAGARIFVLFLTTRIPASPALWLGQ